MMIYIKGKRCTIKIPINTTTVSSPTHEPTAINKTEFNPIILTKESLSAACGFCLYPTSHGKLAQVTK